MSPRIVEASWPLSSLGEALDVLAVFLGAPPMSSGVQAPPMGAEPAALTRWLEVFECGSLLAFQPLESSLGALEAVLQRDLPKLAFLPCEEGGRMVVILESSRRGLWLVCPDGRRTLVGRAELADALAAPLLAEARDEIEPFLDLAAVPAHRRASARRAILGDWLAERQASVLWNVRISAGAPVWLQAKRAGLPRLAALFTLAFAASQAFVVASWWMLGQGVFSGHLEAGYQRGWALVLLSTLPFVIAANLLQGRFSIVAGQLMKARLLRGVTSVDPDQLKHEGVGHQIGRVIEADTFELLTLSGGFFAILGLFQLFAAGVVLAIGPGGIYHVAALLIFCGVILWSAHQYRKARSRWSSASLALTHGAVERMVGNRTRLVQQPESSWHEEEDRELGAAFVASAEMDRRDVAVRAFAPRGWLVFGLLAFLPALFIDRLPMANLALGIGGVLMAYEGIFLLSQSLVQLVHARSSWELVRDLFHAAASRPSAPHRSVMAASKDEAAQEEALPLVEASQIAFRYATRATPILEGCRLTIALRDRILLAGPPGGGKSTLAALLAGLRDTQEGTLLLDGFDRHTLGKEEWRKRVVLVPQFHDNHVFTASLAFNLLVGRRWPAHDEDYRAAEEVCRGLGLGPLIERMPGGMTEMVGEGGWRLSHGERSRVFVARAILQSPRLLILDESFGALDPDNVLRCLEYVMQEPCAVVVISHP